MNSLHKNDNETTVLPLVFSCSGCSSAAQAANELAVMLDRQQIAEMSCIARVGADIPSFVRKAKSAEKIVVLDGCPIHGAKRSLNRHNVEPTVHIDLSKAGVEKRQHERAAPEVINHAWKNVVIPAVRKLNGQEINLS